MRQREEKAVCRCSKKRGMCHFFLGLVHPTQESMADQRMAECESLLLAEPGSQGRL